MFFDTQQTNNTNKIRIMFLDTTTNKQHKQDKNNVRRHTTNNTNKIRIMFLDTQHKQHKQDKNNVL